MTEYEENQRGRPREKHKRWRHRRLSLKNVTGYGLIMKNLYDPDYVILGKNEKKRILASSTDGIAFNIPYSLNKRKRWEKCGDRLEEIFDDNDDCRVQFGFCRRACTNKNSSLYYQEWSRDAVSYSTREQNGDIKTTSTKKGIGTRLDWFLYPQNPAHYGCRTRTKGKQKRAQDRISGIRPPKRKPAVVLSVFERHPSEMAMHCRPRKISWAWREVIPRCHAFGKKVMDAETEKFASHFDDYCCDPYDDGEIKAAPSRTLGDFLPTSNQKPVVATNRRRNKRKSARRNSECGKNGYINMGDLTDDEWDCCSDAGSDGVFSDEQISFCSLTAGSSSMAEEKEAVDQQVDDRWPLNEVDFKCWNKLWIEQRSKMDFDYEYYQKLPKPSQMAMKHLKTSNDVNFTGDPSEEHVPMKIAEICFRARRERLDKKAGWKWKQMIKVISEENQAESWKLRAKVLKLVENGLLCVSLSKKWNSHNTRVDLLKLLERYMRIVNVRLTCDLEKELQSLRHWLERALDRFLVYYRQPNEKQLTTAPTSVSSF